MLPARIPNMDLMFKKMVISSTKSGHQELIQFLYLENSIIGTEKSIDQEKMVSVASMSRSQMKTENQGSSTTPSTRSTLKDQMAREEIEIRPGLEWLSRISPPFCMIAFGGTQKKSSFGLTRDLLNNQNKV